jgi:nucleoside-diphosphate-sugar epimerase
MPHLLLFGPGYTASRLAASLEREGWRVTRIGRAGIGDAAAVAATILTATHILSSVPPDAAGDPVLRLHGAALAKAPACWIGYLSSSGVYGDTGGAWVDESAPIGLGRRGARTAADLAWQSLHEAVRLFRLPGIYGPGRSAFDRLAAGKGRRIAVAGQVFSRIHVDDIVGGVRASLHRGPPGIYNLGDDRPASQNAVIEAACDLAGLPWPALVPLAEAGLSPQARAFYAENRRVANGKAKRLLGWTPRYPDYRAGRLALQHLGVSPVRPRPVAASRRRGHDIPSPSRGGACG